MRVQKIGGKGNIMSNLSQHLRIHAGFPGGNIIVEEYFADAVKVRQDLSMCSSWWFWWYFEAENLSDQPFTVRFVFTEGAPFGTAGPCANINNTHWHWLGRECVENNTFEFKFTPEIKSCRFAFAIPYLVPDLDSFLRDHPDITRSVLTKSSESRPVDLLHIPSKNGQFAVFLSTRHHASESIANFVLEGLLDCRCQNQGILQDCVDFFAVPFMDVDGAENGDQGKNRTPHDFNQDYGKFIYRSTAAYCELIRRNHARFLLSLDLHCPSHNQSTIFWVESPIRGDLDLLRSALYETQHGQLRYDGKNDISFGIEGNNDSDNNSCARYIQSELKQKNAFTLEIPYAEAHGIRINENRARLFGHDLCHAIEHFASVYNKTSTNIPHN